MRIVLDTNVLVSGLLSPFGTCASVVRSLASGRVTLCVDARILAVYSDVLRRPRFSLNSGAVAALLDFLEKSSEPAPALPLPIALPDPDDSPFLEVALAARADCLVTGSTRHFPPRCRSGVRIATTAQFLELLRASHPPR